VVRADPIYYDVAQIRRYLVHTRDGGQLVLANVIEGSEVCLSGEALAQDSPHLAQDLIQLEGRRPEEEPSANKRHDATTRDIAHKCDFAACADLWLSRARAPRLFSCSAVQGYRRTVASVSGTACDVHRIRRPAGRAPT
jgi:hypothetical protein